MLAGMMIMIAVLGVIQNTCFLVLYLKKYLPNSQTNKIYYVLATTDLLTSILIPGFHITPALSDAIAMSCYVDVARVQISAVSSTLATPPPFIIFQEDFPTPCLFRPPSYTH